jgi:hypothetical protein
LLQVLVTFGPVLAQSRPGLQSAPAQGCPLGVLPVGTQMRPDPSREHCSPGAQPHWGTVSLHGSSAQTGPELVEVVVLPVLVGPLPPPLLPVLAPPLPVDVGLLPVLVVVVPAAGLPVVVAPPGPLESPPSPPVVAALAHAEARRSKLPKKRRDRGRMRHLANEKKRVPEPTPVTSKVNVLRDPS